MPENVKQDWPVRWGEFFADKTQIIKAAADSYPSVRSIVVDFADLDHFDSDFAQNLFVRPRTMLATGERAIKELLPAGCADDVLLQLRIAGLPKDREVPIRKVRVDHLGKMITVVGLIRRAAEVKPRYTVAVFECLRCGRHIPIDQDDAAMREPLECIKDGTMDQFGNSGCGRVAGSTSFRLVPEFSTFVDLQKIELQEMPEDAGGAQPASMVAIAEGDQAGIANSGDRVRLHGILRSRSKKRSGQATSTTVDTYLEVSTVERMDPDEGEIELTESDIDKIKELAADPDIYAKLTQSVSPTIYGLDVEKQAIVMQIFGGVSIDMPDGTHKRGDIHILLVGDPATAKSQLLSYVSQLVPRGILASGKSASAAGLTAAAVKDEFGEGRWTLEAGAMVLADKGMVCIDELDKMTDDDRSSMHTAMEQGYILVNKAGINARLWSRATVLAAANPKLGRFSPDPVVEQFELDPTLLSRFDLIFVLKDVPNADVDGRIARHIIRSHAVGMVHEREKRTGAISPEREVTFDPSIIKDLLRKYVHYAKDIVPQMSPEAMKAIEEYYLQVRSGSKDSRTVPITPRQLEALIRLSGASARIRLSEQILIEDAERAIAIFKEFMNRVIGLPGVADVDGIMTGMPRSQVDQMQKLHDIVADLQAEDKKGAPIAKVKELAVAAGIPAERVEKLLEKAKRPLGLYEPKEGIWKVF